MQWDVNTAERLNISDRELSELLLQVYVEGGHTDQDTAKHLFEPSALRARGKILGARDRTNNMLAALVILVPPSSHARRLAQDNEVEMQLLAVKSDYRRHGLGRLLVQGVVDRAKQDGHKKIILWTQTNMTAAQALYESSGFVHTQEKDFSRGGRDFLVYEQSL